MTETQLRHIYTECYQAKSLELRKIAEEAIEKAREKQTAYHLELGIISIVAIGYIQSKFIQRILEVADLNYKLGGDFKELCVFVKQVQESYKNERTEYFEQKKKKHRRTKSLKLQILGVLFPIFEKLSIENEDSNPFFWSSDLETEKSEEGIIKLYAEIRATLYYYKRVIVKNNRLKAFGKATNKHKITIMNEIFTTVQNHLPEITYFLGEGLAKGVFSAQGKDLWEKVKEWFTNDKEKAIVAAFETAPQDVKQQGKLELLLEQKFEHLSENDVLDFFQLYLKAKGENPHVVNYKSKIGDNSDNNIIIQGNGNTVNR